MPYDTNQVARQIETTLAEAKARVETNAQTAVMAAELYHQACRDLEKWRRAIAEVKDRPRHRYALPELPLDGVISDHQPYPHPTRIPASGYRVVAADSSFIEPDRHRGAFCHLINVGRVMLQYGAEESACIDSIPQHCSDYLEPVEEQGSTLSAECIALEMAHLYELAAQHRPDLAIYDGTLYQTGSNLFGSPGLSKRIEPYLDDYNAKLREFHTIGVPIIGYISLGRATYVARALIAGLRSSLDIFHLSPQQRDYYAQQLAFLADTDIFEQLLAPGERSLIFQPWFSEAGDDQQDSEMYQRDRDKYFTYLMVDEVVRIEFPRWVLPQFERVHELILSQCTLGKGYPIATTLADQYAKLRNQDRATYFYLLEQMGLARSTSAKARSKQEHGGNI